MHCLFSLRIKGLYMFGALHAHPQEAYTSGTWYIACELCQLAVEPIEITEGSRGLRLPDFKTNGT
jgi:hypothetical protein